MRDATARLVVKSGEKGTMHCISDLHYMTANKFAKAFLVTELFTESHNAHEDNLLARSSNIEDPAWNGDIS